MAIKLITSRKNEVIKHTLSLLNSAEERRVSNQFVVEGARLCEDAVRSNASIFRLFYTEKAMSKYSKYINEIKEKATEVYMIEDHVASLISATKNTQGVFVVCDISKKMGEIKGKILVMEQLQDPANMGAILRTGEAIGIDTFVFLGDCVDIYSPKVTRSSMGAIFRVNYVKFNSLESLFAQLNKNNYKAYAAVPNDKAKEITKVDFSGNVAVFVGNEGNGLTEECINMCESITIPMLGRAESLNASVAANIIMWEMVRNV